MENIQKDTQRRNQHSLGCSQLKRVEPNDLSLAVKSSTKAHDVRVHLKGLVLSCRRENEQSPLVRINLLVGEREGLLADMAPLSTWDCVNVLVDVSQDACSVEVGNSIWIVAYVTSIRDERQPVIWQLMTRHSGG